MSLKRVLLLSMCTVGLFLGASGIEEQAGIWGAVVYVLSVALAFMLGLIVSMAIDTELTVEEEVKSLIYEVGTVQFTWLEDAESIELYSMTGDGQIGDRIGFLSPDAYGERIPFEVRSFKALCRRFLDDASEAEIVDEDE